MNIKIILLAFAFVESSNNPNAIGDSGLAYGKYQFHFARWVECGGTQKEWKNCSSARQDEIMLNEIKKVQTLLKLPKYKEIDFIQALATYHNNGHIKREETSYVKKIKIRLKEMGY